MTQEERVKSVTLKPMCHVAKNKCPTPPLLIDVARGEHDQSCEATMNKMVHTKSCVECRDATLFCDLDLTNLLCGGIDVLMHGSRWLGLAFRERHKSKWNSCAIIVHLPL